MLADILQRYLWPIAVLAVAYFIGHIAVWIILRLLEFQGRRKASLLAGSIFNNLSRPLRFLVPFILVWIALPLTDFAPDVEYVLGKLLNIIIYVGIAWLIIEMTDVVGDLVRHHFNPEEADNLHERKVITQLTVIKRFVGVVVVFLAIAFILLEFPTVRELGAGLLTSAGIAGIVIGIAAQRPISNLLAGFQIAFTQPVRIDDVVVVEGEFGRIEEITLTYVVVRLWDQRRLVVPLMHFLEKPFQNWTRSSSEVLGTVFFYSDYNLPVAALRQEFEKVVENAEQWDGRVKVMQVTNTTEQTMEVRALVSAANASLAWDLRCLVREKLVTFLQENYPECLPRTRVELFHPQAPDRRPSDGYSAEAAPGLADNPDTEIERAEPRRER